MRNLLFTSAGDRSRHRLHWLKHESRKRFDLALVYYGDQPSQYAHDADFYLQRKGTKWSNFVSLVQGSPGVVENYSHFMLLDDDIEIDTDSINQLFTVANQYDLWLCQPALSGDSAVSWPITKQRPSCLLRFTDFVECGAPLFSKCALEKCLPSFSMGLTGYGMDIAWSKLLGDPIDKMAIIDSIPARHPHRKSELDSVLSRELHRLDGAKLLSELGIELASPIEDWHPREHAAVKSLSSWIRMGPFWAFSEAKHIKDGARRWVRRRTNQLLGKVT